VDVGGPDALDIISGDLFFETAPGSFDFHHSFQTTALVPDRTDTAQVLRGPVKVHRLDIVNIGRLDLTVPEQGDLIATYSLFRLTNTGRQTALEISFVLDRVSNFFRSVELEMESVAGVPFPEPFQTSDHPDTPVDEQGQTLTVASVYRAAGIDMNVTLGGEEIPVSEAGVDGLWTDEELHAAMVNHFDEFRNVPQWRLYMLLATRYVETGVLGIMFDAAENDEFHRQGAAVFHDHPRIANAAGAEKDREYLFTITHELGHAFNFLHSFQKGLFDEHGVLPRPEAESWMNYPQLYPFGFAGPAGWDGSDRFWSRFRFAFDRDEIHHLRHHDRSEVIAGGRSFGFAGHFEERPFELPGQATGLSLQLWCPQAVEFLQQVEGDIRLRNETGDEIEIPPSLNPNFGHVDMIIRRPADRFPKVYRGIANGCMRSEARKLLPGEAVYQEISPSYGRMHWFIDEPGTYELQAVVKGVDGARIVSNIQRVRVLAPDPTGDRMAPDFYNDKTGAYLSVEGSRCSRLDNAREMLEEVRQRMPKSRITKQIEMTNALRDTRVFKDVANAKIVKEDRGKAANAYLKAAGMVGKKKKLKLDETLSHLRFTRALRAAARACAADKNSAEAKKLLKLEQSFLKSVAAPAAAMNEAKSYMKSLEL